MNDEISYSKRNRAWGTQNLGTGQNPNEKDENGFCRQGGVDMPAPVKSRHLTDGAGKPEAGRKA